MIDPRRGRRALALGLAGGLAVGLVLCGPGGAASRSSVAAGGATAAGSGEERTAGESRAREEIRRLLDAGRYAEAEPAARAWLEEREASAGPDSLEAAGALDLLVESLWRGGKAHRPETGPLAERALRIKEARRGPDDPGVAASLEGRAEVLSALEDSEAARKDYERALAIRERALGRDHLDVAESLDGLADILTDLGANDAARPLYERALAIEQARLGTEDRLIARSLQGLGVVLSSTRHVDAGLRYFERALAMREKVLGPDHPDVATTLNSYAWVLAWQVGDLKTARALLERALRIREKALGPDHPKLMRSRSNLAVILFRIGDYAAARPLFERAVADAERIFGPGHASLAYELNRLALFRYFLGDYAAAKPLHERALVIREKAPGMNRIDLAATLNNLAMVDMGLGEYAEAKPLAERAVAIWEKAGDFDQDDFARGLDTLARLLYEMGDPAAARPVFERTLAVWGAIRAPDPGDTTIALNGLAEVLLDLGDPAGARPLFERALAIREKILGPDHPDVARTLSRLARLQWITGERGAALQNALRSEAIARRQFRATARSMSEREALRYEEIRASGLDVAISVLLSTAPARRQGGMVEKVWDELVRSRGMVLDEMAARHRVAVRNESTPVAPLARELEQARNRLARLVVEGSRSGRPEEYRGRLAQAQQEKENAERALAEKSDAFRLELAGRQVGLAEVRRALPPGGALVSYVQYERQIRPAGRGSSGAPRLKQVSSYLALVVRRDAGGAAIAPLGSARTIEDLVRRWREQVSEIPAGLPGAGGKAELGYREAGEGLRRAIWDPVARHLGGSRLVFIVPDGALNLVSLATLPEGEERYLVERGPLLHYLSAEREIVRPEAGPARGKGLLALGGVDFDAKLASVSPAAGGAGPAELASPAEETTLAKASLHSEAPFFGPEEPGVRRAACADFRSLSFEPLPNSRAEVDEIEALWREKAAAEEGEAGQVLKLTGAGADKETFKRTVAGHRVVHLATHGFFAEDLCPSALDRARGAGARGNRNPEAPGIGDNPLLLTGLALAGANRRETARRASEDGILTAEEIASLDLSGVEWAVLSACETGIGKVQVGEGVLGLRRAFEVAGAGTLILSLWSVEDQAAREWMKDLYEERLGGRTTAEAVREASLKVIGSRRKAGRSTHPAYWGAFVATGDWR